MFYLIYLSSVVRLLEGSELLSLLQQSRRKNLGSGITGMLLYKEGNFMQMPEGWEQALLQPYDTIKKTPRRKHLITVITHEIGERVFENWSMGFCNWEKMKPLPDYDVYIEANLTLRSFQLNARKTYRFMVSFNEASR